MGDVGNFVNWYVSELWILGRRASLSGELAFIMGDVGNKGNLYYFLPYLPTHIKIFFSSYKTVPKSLRQSLNYSFRKPIFYFRMPCYRFAIMGDVFTL